MMHLPPHFPGRRGFAPPNMPPARMHAEGPQRVRPFGEMLVREFAGPNLDDATAEASRQAYQGRATVDDEDESFPEESPQCLWKVRRVGKVASRPAHFKDRHARSKEKSLCKGFFEYAKMMTLADDDDSNLDDSYDDGVRGERIVPALFIYDPFHCHDTVGGAPRAAEPVREREKPQIIVADKNVLCKDAFKSMMTDLVENDFKGTDEFNFAFFTNLDDCVGIRSDHMIRERLNNGSTASVAESQSPSTRERASATLQSPDADDDPRRANLFYRRPN